jgi:rhamnulokinase
MTDRIKRFSGNHGLAVPTAHREIMSTVVRSIAAAYAETIRNIEQASGVKIERICVMGGGSQNQTLNRLTEQATALPLVLGPPEATALEISLSKWKRWKARGWARLLEKLPRFGGLGIWLPANR